MTRRYYDPGELTRSEWAEIELAEIDREKEDVRRQVEVNAAAKRERERQESDGRRRNP